MCTRKYTFALKLIAVILIAALTVPGHAFAALPETVQPMASYYLDSYNAYVCAMGGGRVEVWFEVTGDVYMDDIGSLSILLFESTDKVNWTQVETFLHEDYDNMLAQGEIDYVSYVPYQGVAGRYYKAYVCIWAGKNDDGDSRYMWTAIERAT